MYGLSRNDLFITKKYWKRVWDAQPKMLGVSKKTKLAMNGTNNKPSDLAVPYSYEAVSTRVVKEGSQSLVSAEVSLISDTEYRGDI